MVKEIKGIDMSQFHKDRLNEKINELKFESNDNKPYKDVLKNLFDTENNINAKTELSHDEIYNIARVQLLAELTDNQLVKDFVKEFKELRVSLNRKGRQEVIDIFNNDIKINSEESEKKRFFGLW